MRSKFIWYFSLFIGLSSAFFVLEKAHAESWQQDILKAETYLKNLKTARANFIQKSSEGPRLSGVFYLNRPGRLRFEYNEVDDFIVADGFLLYFYDAELKEQTHTPIGLSLADFLLRSDLELSDDITVQDVNKNVERTVLTLVQTDSPEEGSLQLFFSNIPYALKKWRVIDPQGVTIEVELKDMQKDIALSSSLFAYHDPNKAKHTYNE